MKPGIFLSHNAGDKQFVRRLGADLEHSGARVWIDEAAIRVGESLLEKIAEGIEQTDYLAVILSPNSVKSEWVRREVDVALNFEIRGSLVCSCLNERAVGRRELLDRLWHGKKAKSRWRSHAAGHGSLKRDGRRAR